MKKLFSILLLMTVFVIGANAQLLYKISGKDLQKPSYIIGTYHLANVGFVDKIPGVKDALTNTEQVYGELDMTDLQSADNMKKMQNAMMLPEGQSLKTILTADQMKRLNAYLKKTMSVDMSSPMVEKQMGKLTPQALVTQLTLLMFMTKHMGEFDPSSTFDQYFQAQAKKNNEPVGGFETVDFQIKTLLQSTPMKRQVEQLMCLIDHQDFMESMSDKIVNAFYAQDLTAVKAAMDEKIGNSCDSTPEEEDALINNRNADWLTKMPAIMSAKPTFFAVGAGHLPGDKGVLQLLKNAGYTVEGVN
jgi:uncharacterized protein YbaP (TraB family)